MGKITRKESIKLFLIIAFPIHTWSLTIALYNFEWIAARTDVWDSIGYCAYTLTFALFETIVIFLIFSPFYYFLTKNRDPDTAIAIIGTVFLLIAIWEMIYRINISNQYIIETTILKIGSILKIRYRYKIALLFLIIIGPIAGSIGLTPFMMVKYDKLRSIALDLFQRIELLSYLYLTMDLLGIAIIIIRNLT
jgi:hypothetical protein